MHHIVLDAKLRIEIPEDTTEEQIDVLIKLALSDTIPTFEDVLAPLTEHLKEVASADQKEVMKGVTIHEASIWVDDIFETWKESDNF